MVEPVSPQVPTAPSVTRASSPCQVRHASEGVNCPFPNAPRTGWKPVSLTGPSNFGVRTLVVVTWLLVPLCARAAETPATRPSLAAAENRFYRLVDISLARSNSNSRDTTWKPGVAMSKAPVLEISGIVPMDGKRLAVTTRIGDVWMIDGAYDEPADLQFTRFATGLHEPLGLLRQGDSLLTMQRTELTQLRDADGDGSADEYLTATKGWNVSGNYHEYAFGPKRDKAGNLGTWAATYA